MDLLLTHGYFLSEDAAEQRVMRPYVPLGILSIAGLNIIAPPPASQSFAFRYPKLTAFLFSADRFIQGTPLLRALGDHTVFVLRRRTGS